MDTTPTFSPVDGPLYISGLNNYPIKSLSGIALSSALVTERGLQHDRRLMIVSGHHRAITQRDVPDMALLQPALEGDNLVIHHKHDRFADFRLPLEPPERRPLLVSVWDDDCMAFAFPQEVNTWFSRVLQTECSLVFMPDATHRFLHDKSQGKVATSFADEHPFSIVREASLADLNRRLETPVPMNRFRPNIVFTGGAAFAEDQFEEIQIGEAAFHVAGPCARCSLTTINQVTAHRSKEPLRSLSLFRKKENKIYFAQNMTCRGAATGVRISIGELIKVTRRHTAPMFDRI